MIKIILGVIILGVLIIFGGFLYSTRFSKGIQTEKKNTQNQPQVLYPEVVDPQSTLGIPYRFYLLKQIAGSVSLAELYKTGSYPENYRFVQSENGDKKISVIEGYRAIYRSSAGDPYAKMHVDKSAPGKFDEDRSNAIAEINYIFRNRKDLLLKSDYQGYEYYIGEAPAKSGVKILGTSLIIFPKNEIVVTIYFFVPQPNADNFGIEDLKGFRKQQEDFMYEIIDSVRAGRQN